MPHEDDATPLDWPERLVAAVERAVPAKTVASQGALIGKMWIPVEVPEPPEPETVRLARGTEPPAPRIAAAELDRVVDVLMDDMLADLLRDLSDDD